MMIMICIQLRNDVVNQQNGSVTLHTKYHYDDMVSQKSKSKIGDGRSSTRHSANDTRRIY